MYTIQKAKLPIVCEPLDKSLVAALEITKLEIPMKAAVEMKERKQDVESTSIQKRSFAHLKRERTQFFCGKSVSVL